MELRRYLHIVVTYRWHLVLCTVAAALVALAATYAVSQRFTGVATVQIIPSDTEPSALNLRTPDGGSIPVLGTRDPTELLSQGIIQMAENREVAALVASDLKVADAPPPQGLEGIKAAVQGLISDAWAILRFGYVAHGDASEKAIDTVLSSVSAQVVRTSYFMTITATSRDPQMAAAMANSAVHAIITHSRRVASAAAAEQRQFLETQVASAKQKVDAARQAVLDYTDSTHTVPGDSVRLALAALDSAQTSERQNNAALADAQRRLAVVEEQLPQTPIDATTIQSTSGTSQQTPTTRSTSANPVYVSLQDRANALHQQISALELGPNAADSPAPDQDAIQLADARGQLSVAEQQIASTPAELVTTQKTNGASSGPAGTQTTTPNPVFVSLQDRVNILRQQVAGLEARPGQSDTTQLADVRGQLSVAQQQLSSTPPELISVQKFDAASAPSAQSQTQTTTPNPIYGSLQDRINTLNQQIAALEARQGQAALTSRSQNDAALAQARTQLATVEQQLQTTPAELTTEQRTDNSAADPSSTSTTTAANPIYVGLQDRANQLRQDIAVLQAKQAEAAAQTQGRAADLQSLLVQDGKLASLNQELALASDAYSKRTAEWSNAALAEARPVSQLRIIDPATTPPYPSYPIKIIWVGIGAAAGLLVGALLAFVLYTTDLSLRSAAEAEAALGDVRLLAVVPTSTNGKHRPLPVRNGHSQERTG